MQFGHLPPGHTEIPGKNDEQRYQKLLTKISMIEQEKERLECTMVGGSKEVQAFLEKHESTTLKTAASLAEILRRPEMKYEYLQEIDPEWPNLPQDVCEQVEIDIKYAEIKSLRIEAVQKLNLCKPISVGQASRISGVSPADISVLLVYLEQHRGNHQKES